MILDDWTRESYFEASRLATEGQWNDFCELVECRYQIMQPCFKNYFAVVPDEMKRDFAIACYVHHGNRFPAVRAAVRSLLRYSKPELPHWMQNAEEITVYRAGMEDVDHAKYQMSWTTDCKVAEFFAKQYIPAHFDRYTSKKCPVYHKPHIFKGQIRTDKIIAYTDERQEKEIIQYRNIRDIKTIL